MDRIDEGVPAKNMADIYIDNFKRALEITDKCFPPIHENIIYAEGGEKLIEWSEDSVSSVFAAPLNKRVGVLNFADPRTPGGLVWQGADTQEEALCRASNLYKYLESMEDKYSIDGKLIYTRDVVFFMDSGAKLRSPRKVDVITCPSPISSIVDAERRMKMILDAARLNGVEWLILGKWGCGAFENDWSEYKKMWDKVIAESGWKDA